MEGKPPPNSRIRDERDPSEYEPPAIIFEKRIEAVANTCNYDPPLTKATVTDGCLGLTFS